MHNETGGSLIIYLPSGAQCEPITGFSSSRLIATLVMFRRARLLYFGFCLTCSIFDVNVLSGTFFLSKEDALLQSRLSGTDVNWGNPDHRACQDKVL